MRTWGELRVAVIASVLLSCACTEVQNRTGAASSGGLDGGSDSSTELDAASGGGGSGSESRAGRGGAANAGGSSGSIGSGDAGRGGIGPEAGSAGAGEAGKAPEPAAGSGTPAAGSGAQAGSGGAPPSKTVRGTLIDVLRRPITNVELRIGDATVTTDALGKFSLDDVAATYDVGFALRRTVDQIPTTYAWRFEGLTRRDPTLQVYAAAEPHVSRLTWHTRGTTFPLAADHYLLAAFGSPDGDFAAEVNTPDYESPIVYWTGRESTLGTTHILSYSTASGEDLPLQYFGHDAKPVTLTVGETAEATFELENTAPPTGQITGSVTAPGQGDRYNWLALRWNDGTSMVVGSESPTSDSFSYLVPTIANASASVVAFRGRPTTYPLAVGFTDNLIAGQTGIRVDVPLSPSAVAPGAATSGVGPDTLFQWSGDAKVFVYVAEASQNDVYDAMYVVTAAKQTRLPVVPGVPYAPPVGVEFTWHVETHNSWASVDDATSEAGLISAFYDGRLHGPRRGAGSYAASEQRTFTTANSQ